MKLQYYSNQDHVVRYLAFPVFMSVLSNTLPDIQAPIYFVLSSYRIPTLSQLACRMNTPYDEALPM